MQPDAFERGQVSRRRVVTPQPSRRQRRKTIAAEIGLPEVMARNSYDPFEALILVTRREDCPLDVAIRIHEYLIPYVYTHKRAEPGDGSGEAGDRGVVRIVIG